MQRAFESLIFDGYTNFILTVGFIGVAIYCNGKMGFKIFDSRARDLYGRGHPQGTCVLLEIPSLISLVHYFQSIHNNEIFEIKEVRIIKFKIAHFLKPILLERKTSILVVQ